MKRLEIKNAEDIEIAPKANAFRIVKHNHDECALEFIAYDQDTKTASIVSKVYVSRGFVGVIRDRIALLLDKIPGDTEFDG